MHIWLRILVISLSTVFLTALGWLPTGGQPVARATPHTGAVDLPWRWPVKPITVLRPFAGPADPFSAGHRGVDLAANPGDWIRAPAAGTVSFAGVVAGRDVLTLSHPGDLRTTYEPVVATVVVGDWVRSGGRIGYVTSPPARHCGLVSCLHWGVLRSLPGQQPEYLDPLLMLSQRAPVLLPLGPSLTGPTNQWARGSGVHFGKPTTQLQYGLGVHLTDPTLGDTQYLTNFRERKSLVVVEGDHDLFALRQLVDRLGQQVLGLF